MRKGKNWSKAEIEYLKEKYGTVSKKAIAKNLGRSPNAITLKAYKLGLGRFTDCGEYITFNELCKIIKGINMCTYQQISWVKNRGFPMKMKTVINDKVRVVRIEDFWKWAEKNQSLLDFSNFEKYSLGAEPEWVGKKRLRDMKNNYISTPWTANDDTRLKYLLKQYKYSYNDISRDLRRTCGAIQRRICDLGLKERPLKAENHIKWTEEEKRLCEKMITDGYNYEDMCDYISKSTKAIRGYVWRIYGSENLDKVRTILSKKSK